MCYSAAVILWTLVLLFALAVFHFVLIPGVDDPGIFYFIVAIYWTFVVSLAITLAMNFAHRSLLVVPTVVQCGVLVFSVYAIPIAIWGGVLLYYRLQRKRQAQA